MVIPFGNFPVKSLVAVPATVPPFKVNVLVAPPPIAFTPLSKTVPAFNVKPPPNVPPPNATAPAEFFIYPAVADVVNALVLKSSKIPEETLIGITPLLKLLMVPPIVVMVVFAVAFIPAIVIDAPVTVVVVFPKLIIAPPVTFRAEV